MKKLNKKDYINLSIILSFFIIYIIVINLMGYTYGSTVDWISQHFRIPEYLRNLFYSTHSLFPNFAFNLGGGQNIYYLSYHGLFNPIIILSYLFPFIKMVDYIIISNILLVILSCIMLYKWINNKFSSKVAFISTFIFLLAGPIIFHTHRHIMFNDYMLFLILALISVDKYFDTKDKKYLILNVLLIILTSYFYSVGALVTICIYALFKYISINPKCKFKDMFKEGFKFVLIIIVPILISSILLIPTVYTLMSGRSDTNTSINILSLLIPKIDINLFMYKSYSIGLSSIFIISLIENIIGNKKNLRMLSIIISILIIFPIFNYLLNGFMYIDGKSFIPLIPICIYLIANTINRILKKEIDSKKLIIISLIVFIIIIFMNLNFQYLAFFIIDYIIVIGSIIIYTKKKKEYIVIIPIILISMGYCIAINTDDKLVTKEELNNIETSNISISDDSFYRVGNLSYILENVNNVYEDNYYLSTIYSSTSNMYYTNFVRNIFNNEIYNKDYHTITQSSNPLFNIYMGNKYLISKYPIKGYNLVSDNLYVNNDVFGIGYSSNKLMSKEEFDNLSYPYTIDALLNYIIVDKDIDDVYESNIYEYNGEINLTSYSNLTINNENNMYIIDSESNGTMNIKLDDSIKDKVIFVTFDMNYNDKKDTTITINNVINTLSYKGWKYHNNNYTFHYVLDSNNLDITFSKGHYEINNIKIYTMDYDKVKSINDTHSNFIIDKNTTYGDYINGSINVEEDGYFILSIPYDKGFNIKLDNKEIDYELIDTAFIGFEINKGEHKISINYTAPFSNIAKIISIIGVIIYIGIIIFDWRSKNEKN